MKLPTLTQIAKGEAFFSKYSLGELWYVLFWREDGGSIEQGCDNVHQWALDFPIPVSDAGDGDFFYFMKGLNILRWARKYVEAIKEDNEQA